MSRLHRWLAAIVGVQLLLWFSSGAVMSFMSIAQVRGEHLVEKPAPAAIDRAAAARLDAILLAHPEASAIALRRVLGKTEVVLEDAAGKARVIDPLSGTPVEFDAEMAIAIVRDAWRGSPAAMRAQRVVAESTEYRGPLPAWKVSVADPEATHVYVDPATTRIVAVRTRGWRFYDFMWGLHIMDWQNHENFNTPWLLAFALGGLTLALAGGVLLWLRWPRRRLGNRERSA